MSTTATTAPLATSLAQPLARLAAFEPAAFPVLSVYLNTQPDQHGRATDPLPFLHRELRALALTWQASSPQRHSFDRDAERIMSYAGARIDSAARGVASTTTVSRPAICRICFNWPFWMTGTRATPLCW
jgi:hypothetical protein